MTIPNADEAYRTTVSTVVILGDCVQVREPSGERGLRYLAPGIYHKGDSIPYLYQQDGVTPAVPSDGEGQLRL